MVDFKPPGGHEGIKISGEEITAEVMETATEAEVEPEDVTKLLQSHDNTLMNEELLLFFFLPSKSSAFFFHLFLLVGG